MKEEKKKNTNGNGGKINKIKNKMVFNNLSKSENEGIISLKKRVSEGEIIITTTDKSGRMAVITREQYLKAGEVHTKKDEVLDWGKIQYIQNQVNAHTWWFSRIIGNSRNTDPMRMNKNIQEVSSQIPEMSLLIKDHKEQKEGAPIPTRPVLSGNNCLNTHLSELVSEVIEPISTRISSAEVTSTEETLQKLTQLNAMIREEKDWWEKGKYNVLHLIGQDEGALADLLEELRETSDNNDKSLEDTEKDLREQDDNSQDNDRESEGKKEEDIRSLKQPRLAELWNNVQDNNQSVISGAKVSVKERIKNLDDIDRSLRDKASKDKSFGSRIENSVHASLIWGRKLDLAKRENEKFSNDLTSDPNIPSLQNFHEKPVIVGADVAALYPNLKKEVAGEIIYRATTKCDIDFLGIDFGMLSIYLFLVLGVSVMTKCGLAGVIPTRKNKSNARSLLANINKDPNEWSTRSKGFTQSMKREMMGRLLQVLTVVLMSSSCYSFGGRLYRQVEGAGIGERSSACIAKTVMSLWDKLWASTQGKAGIFCPLFVRYVDDLRIYLHPINNGWSWNGVQWVFDGKQKDELSYEERTKQNIHKTLNGILEGITLTVESESDFQSGMLPTLDFQTRVRNDGEVEFLHYMKPMASRLVIQYGTALGKQTVFASLRQELIRRLLHISDHFGVVEQKKVIEDFTQSLANSGHSYSFTKSVILQALTRYKCMKKRSSLDKSNKKYLPLYRDRWYDFERRKKIKGTLGRTWYAGVNYGDKYKQD